MSGRAVSILCFGIYLILTGISLLFYPNLILALMGIPKTTEVWIRIVGVLCINIGFFNVMASKYNYTGFFNWMVFARVLFFISIVSFVMLKWASKTMILFGVVDLLGAAWTILTSAQKKESVGK